jgi:CRISPR/Cas system-associated exonuclease Cas4 (RecB family)
VIDYKYSSAANAKQRQADEDLLQAPLYVMAAEKAFGLKPAGMFYIGLRKKPAYAGWSDTEIGKIPRVAIPPDWVAQAAKRSIAAVEEIRAGRVEPAGTKRDKCARCSYRDSCRALPAGTLAAVEGA